MPDFTRAQRDAATWMQRDACIVAGPGAGKTTVLVERYRHLLETHDFAPSEILAITFTEKAAANMRRKIVQKFEHDGKRRREIEAHQWVSTIHGFCMRLLRENAIAAGIDPRFAVMSARDAERLRRDSLRKSLDEITQTRRAETLALIETLQNPDVSGFLLNSWDGIRSAGMELADVRSMGAPVPPPDWLAIPADLRRILSRIGFDATPTQRSESARVLDWCTAFEENERLPNNGALRLELLLTIGLNRNRLKKVSDDIKGVQESLEGAIHAAVDAHASIHRALLFDVLHRFEAIYSNAKLARGLVDFDDLESLTIRLLRQHEDVRARVAGQFRQIMLDEFQDINGRQSQLIHLLRADGSFFGVGDRNQSIYGFRHARPEIFEEHGRTVTAQGGQYVELLENFRTRLPILRFVEDVLRGRDGITERALVEGLPFAGKDGPSIEALRISEIPADRDAARRREASWVARRIADLEGTLDLGSPGETRRAEFRDFAVLCRSRDAMSPVIEAFDRAGIPYACGKRLSYLHSRIGRDITALLRVIANPGDEFAFLALLRSPLIGLGDEAVLRLRMQATTLSAGLNRFSHSADHCGINRGDVEKLRRFVANLALWRRERDTVPHDLLIARALSACGVDPDPAEGNVDDYLELARTTGAALTLEEFLREIEDLMDEEGEDSELADEDTGNRVQIMTQHAAKGLEFGVVAIVAMDRGTRYESSPVSFTPEHGLGFKWRNVVKPDKSGLKDSWSASNSETVRQREREEENRLLYVAMTRAKEHLILSYICGEKRPTNQAGLVEDYLATIANLPEAQGAIAVTTLDSDPPTLTVRRTEAEDNQVAVVPRPLTQGGHDTSISVTSLAAFASCPRRYYIERYLGWGAGKGRSVDWDEATDDSGELTASEIGTEVHSILAGAQTALASAEAERLAAVFRNSPLGTRAAASARAEREWAFACEFEGVVVTGTIDLWFEEGGGLVVVDYKTDDVESGDVDLRAEAYSLQLAIYGAALERATGLKVQSAWLHFLRPDAAVESAVDAARIGAAICDWKAAQEAFRFELREGKQCLKCPFYRAECPSGRSEILAV